MNRIERMLARASKEDSINNLLPVFFPILDFSESELERLGGLLSKESTNIILSEREKESINHILSNWKRQENITRLLVYLLIIRLFIFHSIDQE